MQQVNMKYVSVDSSDPDYYNVFNPVQVITNNIKNKKLNSQVDVCVQYYNNTNCSFVIRGRDNLAIVLSSDDKDGNCYFDADWDECLYAVKTFSFNQKISNNLIDAIRAGSGNNSELQLLLNWIDSFNGTNAGRDFSKPTKFSITYKIRPSDFVGSIAHNYVKQLDVVVSCFKEFDDSKKEMIRNTPIHPYSFDQEKKPDKPHIGYTRSIELIDNNRHLQNIFVVSGDTVVKIESEVDPTRRDGIHITTHNGKLTTTDYIEFCNEFTSPEQKQNIVNKEKKYAIYHFERDAMVNGDYKLSTERAALQAKLDEANVKAATAQSQFQNTTFKLEEIERQRELSLQEHQTKLQQLKAEKEFSELQAKNKIEILEKQKELADQEWKNKFNELEQKYQNTIEQQKLEKQKQLAQEEKNKASKEKARHEVEVIKHKDESLEKKSKSETFKYVAAIVTGVVAIAAGVWKWFSSRG